MSEENKNPLIEAVLKLQEKMVGYGGTKNNDPYQGRSQQRFTAASTTPDALRVKPSAPAAPKTTSSTSSSAAAPIPKPNPTAPVVVPTSGPAPSPEISAAETDDKLSRSAPNAAAAYAARKLNTTTTDDSIAKKISDTAKSTMDSAKKYADAGAENLESGVESGKKYVKDKFSDFMKWLRSEEYKKDMMNSTSQELTDRYSTTMESTTMSNPLIDAFLKLQSSKSSNLFAEAKKAKKLDPVGKEDEDIDNDGDKDKTDSYLHNRRKKIADAMKEATDPNAEGIAKDKQKAPIMVPKPDYPTSKPGPTRELKGSLPKGVTVKGNTNEAVSPMAGQGTSGTTSAKRGLPLVPAARLAGERQASSESGEIGSRQRSMIDSVKKSAYDAKTAGEKVSAFGKALGAHVAEPFVKAVDAVKGYETPQSKVVKTGKSSSTVMKNEEVEFSEAELAHIASIVEAVAPTPDDHASNATPENNATGGKGRGSMTEEDVVKRGRGRPKGSKSGSKHGGGGNAGGVTHLVDQIKHAGTRGIADGKGNYMLKHEHGTNKDGSPKVHTAAVPQKAANDFYKAYHNTEKPAAKQDLHDKFVAKHFNISKPQTRGISLASMPRPKS